LYTQGDLLYEGKAKKIYSVNDNEDLVWLEYKDSLTAFNALKKGSFDGKGLVNAQITALIYDHFEKQGIQTHIVKIQSPRDHICERLKMIDLEVVVRNTLAGSTAKKFQIEEGTALEKPLLEFFYKKDELQDPFISDDQALMLKTVEKQSHLDEIKLKALKVNDVLFELMDKSGIRLIDFKIEFGWSKDGKIVLGDEVTPDSCRLWEKGSDEKLDKDRFRRDLGKVEESYQKVLKSLKENI
jgi:phosphoribosylaminoimidazole-succinocarboxamide synthase